MRKIEVHRRALSPVCFAAQVDKEQRKEKE
jgi:hypothetical protein